MCLLRATLPYFRGVNISAVLGDNGSAKQTILNGIEKAKQKAEEMESLLQAY